jgi:hypothetical protein
MKSPIEIKDNSNIAGSVVTCSMYTNHQVIQRGIRTGVRCWLEWSS